MPSVIEQAVKALRAQGAAGVEATEAAVVVPASDADGFTAMLRVHGEHAFEVTCEGWSERFSRAEDAYDCFLFVLSDGCRLRVTLRGATPVGWQLERREYGFWVPGHAVKRRLVPIWRRALTVHRQNRVFQSSPPEPAPYRRAGTRAQGATELP